MSGELPLETQYDVAVETVRRFRQHDADGISPAEAQRFGGTVGQIAETADCFIDFLACFLRHLVRRPFIHGAGDCCL